MPQNLEQLFSKVIESAKQQITRENDPSYRYLVEQRSVTPEQISRFNIGSLSITAYSEILRECSEEVLQNQHTRSLRTLLEEGMAVCFPVISARHKIHGICVRTLSDKNYRTYLVPETEWEAHFWNLDKTIEQIWANGLVYIVEGVITGLALDFLYPGTPVIATLSKTITREQKRFLNRFCRHIVVLLDKDAQPKAGAITGGIKPLIQTLDWGKSTGLDLRGIQDLNNLIVKRGAYKARRFLESQLHVLNEASA